MTKNDYNAKPDLLRAIKRVQIGGTCAEKYALSSLVSLPQSHGLKKINFRAVAWSYSLSVTLTNNNG